jgi:NAD(P)H-hydrate epimerase
LRCGAGIVTLASTEKVISAVASNVAECTFLPLKESGNGTVSAGNLQLLTERSGGYNAMLIGCGLSIDYDVGTVVRSLVGKVKCQLVIDADGLNILSSQPELLKKANMPPIITPHHGEMARLCGKTRQEVDASPAVTAVTFAHEYNCYVVLKSNRTVIAAPDGRLAINTNSGNNGLARGGSGDILAGMIASLATQGVSPFDAAKCGVFLHGYAADLCAERLSKRGMLPSDILSDLAGLFED